MSASVAEMPLGLETDSQQLNRAQQLGYRLQLVKDMVGVVGVAHTARAVYGRLANRAEEPEIELRENSELRFPLKITSMASDIWSYVEVFRSHVYRLPNRLDHKINGQPIVDLGAYIGVTATYFASRYPDSQILAVEPHSRNYPMLKANAEPYEDQIRATRAAVGVEPVRAGMRKIGSSKFDYMAYVFSEHYADETSSLSAPGMTPQDVLEQLDNFDQIGILKIDIEGAEKDLFESSAIDPLLERTEILMVESHDQFVPGSSQAIDEGARRNGLRRRPLNNHTALYARTVF